MSKRLKRWLYIVGALCVVVAVIFLLLRHYMNGSATGTVQVGKSQQQSTLDTPQPVSISNSYFTTLLPAGFTIKRQAETPSANVLYSMLTTTRSVEDEQLAVTIVPAPTDGPKGIGDYNLRATQTDTYQPYSPAELPSGATAFRTVSGPAAFAVFWPHNNTYVELAFSTTGGASLDQLHTVYTQVINSWSWK